MARDDRNVYRGDGRGGRDDRYERDRYERERYEQQRGGRGRRYEEEYDEDEWYEDEDVDRKARKGCLIAFLVVVGIVLVALLVGFFILKAEIDGKNATATEAVTLEITSSSGRTVGEQLEDAGLIGNATVFRYYVRFKDVADTFKAGNHTFTPGMSYDELIAELATAPPVRTTVDIRIPEGSSIMSVAALFEQNGFGTAAEFLEKANALENYSDLKFVEELLKTEEDPSVLNRAEGLLYPDTYQFYTDETVDNVIRTLYEKMDSVITDDMYAQMAEKQISMREFLTIASIVQAESGYPDYVTKVSAVVWNRLGDDWPDGTMGMDTTHEYLEKWMQLNLPEYAEVPRSEITAQQVVDAVGADRFYAYNTRVDFGEAAGQPTRKGLPVGPVCSISAASLQAALNPDADYLGVYYYFNNDKYGEHYFARTLAEHNQNVATMNAQNAKYDQEQAEAAAEAEADANNTEQAITLPAGTRLYWPLPRRAA